MGMIADIFSLGALGRDLAPCAGPRRVLAFRARPARAGVPTAAPGLFGLFGGGRA